MKHFPRQRVIASIGEANLQEPEKNDNARAIEIRFSGHSKLFPPQLSPEASSWVNRILPLASRQRKTKTTLPAHSPSEEKIDGVLADSVQSKNIVQRAPELVALHAWNQLRLPPVLSVCDYHLLAWVRQKLSDAGN